MIKKKNKKKKKQVPTKVKKSMLTLFILLFPVLIIVSLMANLPLQVYAIMLFIYYSILVKNFIDDHYKEL